MTSKKKRDQGQSPSMRTRSKGTSSSVESSVEHASQQTHAPQTTSQPNNAKGTTSPQAPTSAPMSTGEPAVKESGQPNNAQDEGESMSGQPSSTPTSNTQSVENVDNCQHVTCSQLSPTIGPVPMKEGVGLVRANKGHNETPSPQDEPLVCEPIQLESIIQEQLESIKQELTMSMSDEMKGELVGMVEAFTGDAMVSHMEHAKGELMSTISKVQTNLEQGMDAKLA